MKQFRFVLATVVAVSPALLGLSGNTSPALADPPTINCPGSTPSPGLVDFDGDGIADAVVAAPGAAGGAGIVEVRFNRSSKTTTFTPGDGMIPAADGSGPPITFATLNVNGDPCTDLAIGIPSYTVGSDVGAGAVQILYGSKDGFVAGPLITPDNAALPGSAQAGENFGAALAGADDELTVGVPGWSPTVGSHLIPLAGEAIVMRIDVTQPPSTTFYNVYALRKTNPHADDQLGTVVADRAASAPGAEGHGFPNAGCFVWSYAGQSMTTYCGHHANDRLGQSLSETSSELVVGAPDHEVTVKTTQKHGKHKGATHTRTVLDAGAVEVFGWTFQRPHIQLGQVINQASKGVPGAPTLGNGFGYSVTTFFGNGRRELLAIGVPGETVKHHRHAGAVLLRLGDTTASPWQQLDGAVTGGSATSNDYFGAAVTFAAGGYPGGVNHFLLYVGVPDDQVSGDAGAGQVQIFTGNSTKAIRTNRQRLTREGGPHPHDRYGFAVD